MDDKSKILFTVLVLVLVSISVLLFAGSDSKVGFATNPNSCSDSDGGVDTKVFGTLTGYSLNKYYSKPDVCSTTAYIYEKYCSGTSPVSRTISCGAAHNSPNYCNGPDVYYDRVTSACSDGACIDSETPNFIKRCPYSCQNGGCVDSTVDSCTESDGGNVATIFGTVSGMLGGSSYSYSDSCLDTQSVTEYYCSGAYKQSANTNCGTDYESSPFCVVNSLYKNFSDYNCNLGACRLSKTTVLLDACTNGCVNGACKGTSLNICTDTDGGLAYAVKGKVAGTDTGISYSKTDFCMATTVLTEYYCSETKVVSQSKTCANCVDGACV